MFQVLGSWPQFHLAVVWSSSRDCGHLGSKLTDERFLSPFDPLSMPVSFLLHYMTNCKFYDAHPSAPWTRWRMHSFSELWQRVVSGGFQHSKWHREHVHSRFNQSAFFPLKWNEKIKFPERKRSATKVKDYPFEILTFLSTKTNLILVHLGMYVKENIVRDCVFCWKRKHENSNLFLLAILWKKT